MDNALPMPILRLKKNEIVPPEYVRRKLFVVLKNKADIISSICEEESPLIMCGEFAYHPLHLGFTVFFPYTTTGMLSSRWYIPEAFVVFDNENDAREYACGIACQYLEEIRQHVIDYYGPKGNTDCKGEKK